jgi:hypothetical protein
MNFLVEEQALPFEASAIVFAHGAWTDAGSNPPFLAHPDPSEC